MQPCQVSKFDLSAVDNKSIEEPDSPANEEKEDDLMMGDEDDSSEEQDDSYDSDEDPAELERKAKEIAEIQQWAQANGFQIAIE